jgi:hypothetical protein
MITIEDLKDFDVWKSWKNGEVQLGSGGGELAVLTKATVNNRTEWRVYHKGLVIARFEEEDRAREYLGYINN